MARVNDAKHKEKRKLLRRNETSEEKIVWKMLRGRKVGMKWRRQVSIGRYVADFYCFERKLAIELDGSYHLQQPMVDYDKIRDEYLKSLGIEVIRIQNRELMFDLESVYQKIRNYINT